MITPYDGCRAKCPTILLWLLPHIRWWLIKSLIAMLGRRPVGVTYKGMVDTSSQWATPYCMGCVSLPPVFGMYGLCLALNQCYNSENDIQQNQSASWCRCRCNKWSVTNDLGLIPWSQVNINWFRWWFGACSVYDFYRHKQFFIAKVLDLTHCNYRTVSS